MKAYPQISLTENINNQSFIELSRRIEFEFKGKIVNDLSDLESKYKDFNIEGKRITLHTNIYTGITIFPTKLKDAEKDENVTVEKIGFYLKYRQSNSTTWTKFRIGGEYEINNLLEDIHYCRVEKGNYTLTSYKEYNGNCDNHDHCQICSTMISCKSPDKELYSSPRNIVCVECYIDFIKEDDYIDKIQTYEKFEKPIKEIVNCRTWLNKLRQLLKYDKRNTDNIS